MLQIYSFSFTNFYNDSTWESLRWHATNNGWASVIQTTPVVLIMYSFPLILLLASYFIGLLINPPKKLSPIFLFLILLLVYFFLIRCVASILVPYHYYYARYLLPEVTILLLLVAMFVLRDAKIKKDVLYSVYCAYDCIF